MKNSAFRIPFFIIVLLTGILLGTQVDRVFPDDNLMENIRKFNDVLTWTDKYYVDEVESGELVENAIEGMLDELDPHSTYISVERMRRIEEEFRGDFEGIGIQFTIVEDTITVVSPITGGPSEALGIMAGDRIVEIEGEDAVGITNTDVMDKLRGPAGSTVSVTVSRPGLDNPLDYEITRDKIPIYSVDVQLMIDDSTGYISISRFSETTTDELLTAMENLDQLGMKRLLLDLRNNPGGYLNQAVSMADIFIDGEKRIVYTRGRLEEFNEDFFADETTQYEHVPLVILINRGSASASEIVAGAVQDCDRGIIAGETSFGKGLVQRQFALPDGSALRLTISEYYTPSGRLIQRQYDDHDDYYEEIMERDDEQEGTNFDHKAEQDSSRPEFTTDKGRTVYGGGGITPDYIINSRDLTDYASELMRSNIYYLFTRQYLDTHGEQINSTYGDDLAAFASQFSFSESDLENLTRFAEDKGVELNEEEFMLDKEYIASRLKAQVARNYWKNKGWYKILIPVDRQVSRAHELFDEAAELRDGR